MPKQGLTAIAFILDKSGSMGAVRAATISGFNEFLRNQRAEPGDALFWLTTFDTERHLVHDGIPLKSVPELTDDTYIPGGMTALHDAVCLTVDRMGERFAALPEGERPERVVCVIQTDGQENSSKEHTLKDVTERVGRQTRDWSWTFLYLGADQDAWITGQTLGINAAQTLSYDAQSAGAAFAMTSDSVSRARSGADASYTTRDIRNNKDEDAK